MAENRLIFIDYLKLLGLMCIILAHVCTNPIIMQLRSFDVPLMVMISGFLAIGSYKRSVEKKHSLFSYYWKRIKRLVFPTWIFLIIYFIFVYIISIGNTYPFDLIKIIRSFLLLDGIGYVWIIRVYLLVSFLTPIIFYVNNMIKSDLYKLILLILIYIFYELFVFLGINELNSFFNYVIAYIIPYGFVFVMGMISKNVNYKSDEKLSLFFLIIFIISAIAVSLNFNGVQPTVIMKYPPTIYYISYALFASFLLISIAKRLDLKSNRIIEFCSKSSLWIYLWHIMFLYLASNYFSHLHWIISYLIIIVGAILVTYVQNRIVDLLQEYDSLNLLSIFRG